MALRTTYSAETWEKIYQAFNEVSFVSYDFDSIKQSLIDYTKTYYPEVFNDYIESSEYIAMLEMFAYIAEQLAYRVDMVAHENFITTAQRKQSILRLAKLISYKATRNIPVRGLVKFNTVTTSERVLDSRGTDLSGLTITWNDPNNSNWKEQFILVMNRVLNTRFGQPSKTFQVGDVVMDLYALRNTTSGLRNGVFPFSASAGLDTYPMEIVPADVDTNGPFEREPDLNSPLSIIYANDGIGDGSDYTGFLGYVKQGTLTRIDYNIETRQPDRRIEFQPSNVNHTDVWVQKLGDLDAIIERWTQVDTISEQNLVFNELRDTRKKFEVDTRENDQITILFGDGDFSDMPQGVFRFWMRQSANRSIVIQKNKVVNIPFGFSYVSSLGNTETCGLTFSLTTTLQNGAGTETIEHIRRSAPSTYYAQNRMVNGQDYNTYLLKDPSIIRLKTINRTFAGQPKYIDWNDASGMYENIKLFGDDATMRYAIGINSQTTSVSGQSLIDSVIEPLLSTSGVINTLLHISATDPFMKGVVSAPRRKFIEDNRGNLYKDKNGANVALISTSGSADGSLKEKTAIQGLVDRHWYGEPLEYVQDETTGFVLARIPDPDSSPKDDSRIYAAAVPRTIDGVNKFPPGDVGSGLQPIAEQDYFGLRYNRYMRGIGNGTIEVHGRPQGSLATEVWTIEIAADGQTIDVRSNLRGSFPSGTVGNTYQISPEGFTSSVDFFTVSAGTTAFEPGDAFILEGGSPASISSAAVAPTVRIPFAQSSLGAVVNLNGWWEILGYSDLDDYEGGIQDSKHHDLMFTTSSETAELKQHSWVIFVRKLRQQPTNNVIGYEVHYRDLKLTIESENTKFWYNSGEQLLDNETKNRVFDNIKILRSNIDSSNKILGASQQYDVVGAVKDSDGIVDFNQLEIVPTDLLQEDASGNLVPDRLLQFETFSEGSYEYFTLSNQVPDTGAPLTELPPIQYVRAIGTDEESMNELVVTVVEDTTELIEIQTEIILDPSAPPRPYTPSESSFPADATAGQRFLNILDDRIYTFANGSWGSGALPPEFSTVVLQTSTPVTYMFENGSWTLLDDGAGVSRVRLLSSPTSVVFAPGSFVDDSLKYGRRQRMPQIGTSKPDTGLDFMWQHFSPFRNIIDPSVTNIHDAYVMTRGYYDNVIAYVRGISLSAPTAPTPLELRNAYGHLLQNKMLSDTVVLHPGKLRLMFGSLAEPQLRAKFKVVKSQAGTLTNERVKEEVLNVINTFFDVDGWDFGDTFYATKLISLIHQRLPADIASVVLVPVYSTNSFGSLFTVEAGFDEILQSAAELSDIEVVEALTPTVIRQSK